MATSKTTTTTMPKARTSTRYLALRSSLPHLPLLCDRPQRSSKAPSLSQPRHRCSRKNMKKKSPSIIKKYSIDWNKLTTAPTAKRKPFVSDESSTSTMHATYTTPGEPGSFGGVRRPFVGTQFDRRDVQRYLHTQDAYTLHRQARRRFRVSRHTQKQSLTSTRQISSTCRVC